ncbi:TetR/AcrR family transcriptional regulator [Chitinophaga pinensis]|uniref:Transcriptional regulator, TetR family n=1 Tax=Chitinophaga pinensis (strain ATCC 43595 / DSM 2588 / LMG 13176 / NBRC 15968 / NCIMB 11800 / UQM 2034) TaxID=485918 RepID=A0A979FZN1_CHIPD|nr:TetR/AcrR family transcriptional regulator [Chitinophaga pinensis]ACU58109.1 transcriptional regulator, TetR family [Chitinophaga pinensis DSM 2588]
MPVKDRILETALRMFRMYGIKSVTMFDISRESGVSKKTVYEHFRDKEELVQEGIRTMLNGHGQHLEDFRQQSANAIEELLKEVKYMEEMGNTINPVMLYEMQKYHPDLWLEVETFKKDHLIRAITANLERGIQEGCYRNDFKLNIMARMRLLQLETVFQPALFPATEFSMPEVIREITAHFLLGIATAEGRKLVAEYLQIKED